MARSKSRRGSRGQSRRSASRWRDESTAFKIDMHGMTYEEVTILWIRDQIARACSCRSTDHALFVHGCRGGTVLRDRLRGLMDQHGIKYELEFYNGGVTIVCDEA